MNAQESYERLVYIQFSLSADLQNPTTELLNNYI